jgi:hypothetical protein
VAGGAAVLTAGWDCGVPEGMVMTWPILRRSGLTRVLERWMEAVETR